MKLLEKIFVERGTSQGSVIGTGEVLTRGELLSKIYEHFLMRFKEETTEEGMLFPASFVIFMNPKDYDRRVQTFGVTVKELVNKCNKFILAESKKYKDYVPHAKYWRFQFVSFKEGSILEDYDGNVDPKELVIMSTIFPTENIQSIGSGGSGGRVVITKHSKSSFTGEDWAINRDALGSVSMEAKDRFTVPFGNFQNLNEVPENDKEAADPRKNAHARLTVNGAYFQIGDERHDSFYMKSDTLFISGPGEEASTGGQPIAHITSDDILFRHIQITRRSGSGEFEVRFNGPVTFNERPYDGKSSAWVPLPNNSSFLIESVSISFFVLK